MMQGLANSLMRIARAMGAGEKRVVSVPGTYGRWGLSQKSEWLQENPEKLLEANQGWMAICVDLISDEVSKTCMELYVDTGRDEWQEVEMHPALDLLENPNPMMDGQKLMKLTDMSRRVYGNALWLIDSPTEGGEPAEILMVPWPWVEPKRHPKFGIIGWRVCTPGGASFTVPYEQSIHFERASLHDLLIGRSEFMRIPQGADLGHFAMSANTAFFRNGTHASTVITTKDWWSQDKREAFYQDFQQHHAGFDRAHLPLLIHGDEVGVEFANPGNKDLDFRSALDVAKEIQLANFRVPAAVLGMSTDYNRANMEAAIVAFQKFAVEPAVEYYYGGKGPKHRPGKIERDYFARFWKRAGGRWRVSYSDFIQEDQEEKRANAKFLLGEGTGQPAASINEIREQFGLDPRDEPNADEVLIPAGKVKLSDEDLSGPAPAPFGFAADVPEQKGLGEIEDVATWKRFARMHGRREVAVHEVLREAFKAQHEEVLRRAERVFPKAFGHVNGWSEKKARAFFAERKDLVNELFPADADEKVFDAFWPEQEKTIDVAAEDLARRLVGRSGPRGETKDVYLDAAIEYLKRAALAAVVGFDSTTKDLLAITFIDILSTGGGLDDLTAAIDEVYGGIDSSRAWRMARTETTTAWNRGQLAAGMDLDFDVRKRWIAAIDERTRDDHREAAFTYGRGNGIPLDQDFRIGDEAMSVPGDPDASPGNRINCRCTLSIEEA